MAGKVAVTRGRNAATRGTVGNSSGLVCCILACVLIGWLVDWLVFGAANHLNIARSLHDNTPQPVFFVHSSLLSTFKLRVPQILYFANLNILKQTFGKRCISD